MKSSVSFLLFYLLVVILLGVSFFALFRKRPKPSKLNMRKGNEPPTSTEKGLGFAGEEVVNVMFNYNGHMWDAFEILGIPAGSEPSVVERAYQAALHSVEESSREMIETAHRAILQRRKSS